MQVSGEGLGACEECVGPTPDLLKQNQHFNKMPGASCARDPGDPGTMRQGRCAPGQAGSPTGSALLAPPS